MKDEELINYVEHTINYFRKNYITDGLEVNYQFLDDQTLKFKIPKDEYNTLTQKLKDDDIDFEVVPSERKMELVFQCHNGKKLLKTKKIDMCIYFVDPAALKNVENITNTDHLNIKNWSDFFESIDPEYRNMFIKII